MIPIIQDAASEFQKTHPDVLFTISEEDNFYAISEAYYGIIDIALSRDITALQKTDFQFDPYSLDNYTIGRRALAIIVNQNNPITNLTPEQIRGIFTGDIENWNQVGGEDKPILTVGYQYYDITSAQYSGVRRLFFICIMNMTEYSSFNADMESNSGYESIKIVAENTNAIGYTHYQSKIQYTQYAIKPIGIQFDGTNILPSPDTINDGTYRVYENLNIYFKKEQKEVIKEFIEYLLSPQGQIFVETNGYIPSPLSLSTVASRNNPNRARTPIHTHSDEPALFVSVYHPLNRDCRGDCCRFLIGGHIEFKCR